MCEEPLIVTPVVPGNCERPQSIAGELGIEEMRDPLLGSLDIDAVLEVGLVDEHLLQACRLENATLVSGDGVLRSRASSLNVRFLEPSELVGEMA